MAHYLTDPDKWFIPEEAEQRGGIFCVDWSDRPYGLRLVTKGDPSAINIDDLIEDLESMGCIVECNDHEKAHN